MKRTWKSLLLAYNWVFLSVGTSILIILTQPIAPVPAQEPAAPKLQIHPVQKPH